MVLELGDPRWTVLVHHARSLFLHRLARVTSVPCGSWPKKSSATGYHGHRMAPYVPAWDIINKSGHKSESYDYIVSFSSQYSSKICSQSICMLLFRYILFILFFENNSNLGVVSSVGINDSFFYNNTHVSYNQE